MSRRLALVGAACIAALGVLSAPDDKIARPNQPADVGSASNWQQTAKRLPAEPRDAGAWANRRARGEYFSRLSGAAKPLDEPQDPQIGYGSSEPSYGSVPEVPIEFSDTIVIAKFVDFQPYLSEDRRSIYTELDLAVEDVIRSGPQSLREADHFTILQLGGSVVLPGGRTVSHGLFPRRYGLLPGERYFLFLRYEPDLRSFTVMKSWHLDEGVAVPNNAEDAMRKVQRTSVCAGMVEAEMARHVRELLNQR